MSLESIKQDSLHLRGTLVRELADDSATVNDDNAQILKFHGLYQQDDRDRRRGGDREYVFMVRASLPGGALSAEQYLVADELADWVGDGSLRITSRQGLQWHQIRKGSLKPLVWTLNQSLVTTFGACGDVVRNVVACPAPSSERARIGLDRWARRVAEHFRPRTSAYWEIWIDGERAVTAEPAAVEQQGITGCVQRVGSMLTLFFGPDRVESWDDARRIDRDRYGAFFRAARRNGVLLPPSPYETWFLTLAHTHAATLNQIDATLADAVTQIT